MPLTTDFQPGRRPNDPIRVRQAHPNPLKSHPPPAVSLVVKLAPCKGIAGNDVLHWRTGHAEDLYDAYIPSLKAKDIPNDARCEHIKQQGTCTDDPCYLLCYDDSNNVEGKINMTSMTVPNDGKWKLVSDQKPDIAGVGTRLYRIPDEYRLL